MKKTLRDLMTDEIMHYDWLDYNYKETNKNIDWTNDKVHYIKYLNALEDEKFLYHYRLVSRAIETLD